MVLARRGSGGARSAWRTAVTRSAVIGSVVAALGCRGGASTTDGAGDALRGAPSAASAATAAAPSPASTTAGAGPRAPARRCREPGDLRRAAPPFRCAGDRCVQESPRRPSAAEWDCADPAGIVVCVERGGQPLDPTPGDDWRCSVGRTPRVCVDEHPDLPDDDVDAWRCRFDGDGPVTRVCERAPAAGRARARCDAAHPCQDGLSCRAGSCARPREAVECWLDADCERGPCRSALCRDGAPRAPAGATAATGAASAGSATGPPRPGAPSAGSGAAPGRPRAPSAGSAAATAPSGAMTPPPRDAPARDSRDPGARGGPGGGDVSSGTAWLRVEVDPPLAGYGQPFTVRVTPGCEAARGGSITLTLEPDPRLLEVRITGGELRARWPPAAALGVSSRPSGLVPLSAGQAGLTWLTATWSDGAGAREVRRIPLLATAPARGVSSVPLNTPLWLSGAWSVLEAPAGAGARPAPFSLGFPAASATAAPAAGAASSSSAAGRRARAGDTGAPPPAAGGSPPRLHSTLSALVPDAPGRWILAGPDGHGLELQVGRWDAAPLDCERCHAEASASARRSRMPAALARGLAASPDPDYPGCALGCHAVGHGGLEDGGLAWALAARGLDADALHGASWRELSPELQRVSGVGCQACHGPGTIPEPRGRGAVREVAVCATCHDAPPRYGHVAAFAETGMARAGLGCITCHDPHGGPEGSVAQLRLPAPPPWLDGAAVGPRSAVCVSCHGPQGSGSAAPAAAFWAGRAGLDAGVPGAPAPHAGVECVTCHGDGPAALERGRSHRFRADPTRCQPCHATPPPDPGLWAGAAARWRALTGKDWPAGDGAAVAAPQRPELQRLRLVLGDRAAWVHGAPLARALIGR